MKAFLLIVIIITAGCSSRTSADLPGVINEIEKTGVYQDASKKVDSLKANGMNANIQIAIVSGQQLNPEDSLTKIKVALIEISILNGVDELESYKVKYDSVSNKILKIERQY